MADILPVRLEWTRYPDGFEVLDRGDLVFPAPLPGSSILSVGGAPSGGEWFKPKTGHAERYTHELGKLDNPIVLHLINSLSARQEAQFIRRYGLPTTAALEADNEYGRHELLPYKANLLELLSTTTSNDSVKAIEALQSALKKPRYKLAVDFASENQTLRLRHDAGNLYDFMVMECVAAGVRGTRLTGCQHCSKLFLTGHSTERRSDAQYCEDKCRVAANRARKAAAAIN